MLKSEQDYGLVRKSGSLESTEPEESIQDFIKCNFLVKVGEEGENSKYRFAP